MTQDSSATRVLSDFGEASGQSAAQPEASAVFTEHCDYVWNTLRRLGVARAELQDFTHDTFVAVFRQLGTYDPRRPIKPWLFGFALRVASDHRRRARHRHEIAIEPREPQDSSPDASELMVLKERRALAHEALGAIELGRRAVFILHELDGAPIPEVAAALNIPVATAYSRLRLAREQFSAAVKRLSLRAR